MSVYIFRDKIFNILPLNEDRKSLSL